MESGAVADRESYALRRCLIIDPNPNQQTISATPKARSRPVQ
jgi:hypothetical protein